MIEPTSDHPVRVTAEERTHPAILKLAHACIALARQLAGEASPQPTVPSAEQQEEGTAVPSQERPNA